MKKRNETLWNTVRSIAEHELTWLDAMQAMHKGEAKGAPYCIITLPMHPAYGLADQTRLMALRDAAALGVDHAAKTYKVHPTAIYGWRKALLELVGY